MKKQYKAKPKKRFFLIDIENVGKSFLTGVNQLTQNDTLILCNNSLIYDDFSPLIMDGLKNCKAKVRKFYINSVCKNAMDFELVLELGFLIAKYADSAEYYVVSKDRGFDIVNDYLNNKGLSTTVRRIPSLNGYLEEDRRIKEMEDTIKNLLPEYPNKTIITIQQGIDQTGSAKELYAFLQKHLRYEVDKVFPKIKYLCCS